MSTAENQQAGGPNLETDSAALPRNTAETEQKRGSTRVTKNTGRTAATTAASPLPRTKSTMILRHVSKMFHQHSDMFLQQAAVLERIAANPSDPSSWEIDEPSPESVQDKLHNENVVSLAIKSYESMLEVQKRVDYMERLMIKNGIEKHNIIRSKTKPKQKVSPKSKGETAFSIFQREHSSRLAHDLEVPVESPAVLKEVRKLWKSVNPLDRLRFSRIAEQVEQKRKRERDTNLQEESTATKSSTGSKYLNVKSAARLPSQDSSRSDDASSSDSECDSETLFQHESRSRSSSAKRVRRGSGIEDEDRTRQRRTAASSNSSDSGSSESFSE